ncbi:hypothetical protein D3C84_456250 [compost metagenome]
MVGVGRDCHCDRCRPDVVQLRLDTAVGGLVLQLQFQGSGQVALEGPDEAVAAVDGQVVAALSRGRVPGAVVQ